MRHGLPCTPAPHPPPPRHSLLGEAHTPSPITTEPKHAVGGGDGPSGTALSREGCETVGDWAGSTPPNRTLCPRGLFSVPHSPPRSSMRTP